MSILDEGVFYISKGSPSDKNQTGSIAYSSSLHNSSSFQSFRQCASSKNGFVFLGGHQEKLIVACPNKALIQVYSLGKESPDQRIPIPEELTCLALCNHAGTQDPWLLAGGSKTGKLYVWEFNSGLLLHARELHYQAVTSLKFTHDGEFIVSGSVDSRVIVWKTFDLITLNDDSKSLKPYAVFTEHTLLVNDIVLTKGKVNDLKFYSCSQDGTVRCYDIRSKSLLTTLVASAPVNSLALDPAERTIFLGLETGIIRLVPLYVVDPQTRTLQKVGGNGKIITIPEDPNLKYSFVHHQGSCVTTLLLSIDATYLCSGDESGRVFASDVITRQNLKQFKELPFGISGLICFIHDSSKPNKHIIVPVLKRVLATESDLIKHELFLTKPQQSPLPLFNIQEFIDIAKSQEVQFLELGEVQSTVTTTSTSNDDKKKILELEEQLQKMTKGYASLREIHEELYKEHTKLIGESN